MQTRTPRQASGRHRLLSHERWLAEYGARRGPAPQGSDRRRMRQSYGPEEMALLLVAGADGIPGGLIGFAGLVLLYVTGSVIAGCLIGTGIFMMLAGAVRGIQAGRAGRLYRNGRPFIRVRDR